MVGLLSILALGALLGLGKGFSGVYTHMIPVTPAGIRGILVAKELNLCDRRSNATVECVIESTIGQANTSSPSSK